MLEHPKTPDVPRPPAIPEVEDLPPSDMNPAPPPDIPPQPVLDTPVPQPRPPGPM